MTRFALWYVRASSKAMSQNASELGPAQPPGAPCVEPDERMRVLALLRRFGWNATSFQAIEPGFRYHFDSDDACVAYVETGHAWVAAGAPIAAPDRMAEVALGFVRAARRQARRAAFFGTEQRFVNLALFDSMAVGEQPEWNPQAWSAALARSRSLREQLRRARAKGVRVRRLSVSEIGEAELPVRRAIEQLIARWLKSRSMAPMGFLVRVHLFDFLEERRVYVAERGEQLCALLALVPVYARNGWFVEDLLRAPDAPNGTNESLVDRAMRDAAADGCSYVTLGLAPLGGDVERWLRAARRLGSGLYDFSGLRTFKDKFQPREWVPIYLSHPRETSSHLALYDSLVAFSQGGLLRFGLGTLLRGPALVMRGLMLLLVPWTIALACLDSTRFFPSDWVKWSWVALDILLALTLRSLTRRFRPRLALALTFVVAGDALLTLLQALLFNVPRACSAGELFAIAIGVCAPALAAIVLFNAWKRSTF
jgi:phosphatidylglycerol lysyltransferase